MLAGKVGKCVVGAAAAGGGGVGFGVNENGNDVPFRVVEGGGAKPKWVCG